MQTLVLIRVLQQFLLELFFLTVLSTEPFEVRPGNIIKADVVHKEREANSLLQCAYQCLRDGDCMSASYNDENGICQLSKQRTDRSHYEGLTVVDSPWTTIFYKALLTNVALHRRTTGSRQYLSDKHPSGKNSNAVDGNRDQNYHNGSCTHSAWAINRPFWKVDLGETYWIAFIRIFNRGDCCGHRLRHIFITTSKDNNTFSHFAYRPNEFGLVENVYPDDMWTVARWVKITKNYTLDDKDVLCLCEVEVMARQSLPESNYGIFDLISNTIKTWF